MGLRDWIENVPSPRHVAGAIGRQSASLAVSAGGQLLERLDARVPDRLRGRLPTVLVDVGGVRYRVQGVRVRKEEAPTDDVEPPEQAAAAPLSDGSRPDEVEEGGSDFFSSLPRGARAQGESADQDGTLPSTTDDVRSLIHRLRDTIDNLDDVKDYEVVGQVDDDMYQLWRELERKMQRHRQSEAKHQLKDMFSI